MGDTTRLFIGTRLSGAGRAALDAFYAGRNALDFGWPGRIAWTAPEKWHLTWLFLGDVPEDRLESLKERLPGVVPDLSPPVLRLNRLEIWPSAKRPRMAVWCGDGEALTPVAQGIREAYFDFPEDKPFRPHVTLARFRSNDRGTRQILVPRDYWPQPADWRIGEITLFRSHLKGDGTYEALCTASLSDA